MQTFGDVLERFRYHPESKSAAGDGLPGNQETVGLLSRLHIHAISITHIGKETNLLEQQEKGVLIVDPQAIYSSEREWEAIRSQLNRVSISELSIRSGASVRMLRSLRKGDRRPSAKNLRAIMAGLGQMLDEVEG